MSVMQDSVDADLRAMTAELQKSRKTIARQRGQLAGLAESLMRERAENAKLIQCHSILLHLMTSCPDPFCFPCMTTTLMLIVVVCGAGKSGTYIIFTCS